MYKILIADDEGIVRESLQFILEKNFREHCTLYFAKNGRQAIESTETLHPDLCFLDIQMPGINGLKALEEMRALKPGIRVIILTAYDNVDFAKEALHLGAVEYLTKPIQKDLIVSVVHRQLQEIEEEKKKRQEELRIREKMDNVVPILENGLIQSLILRGGEEQQSLSYRELLEIREEFCILMVLEWGEKAQNGDMGNPVGSSIRGYQHAASMLHLIKGYVQGLTSSVMGNHLVVLLPREKETAEYRERVDLIERARVLRHALEDTVKADFRIGIGSVRTFKDAYLSYEDALNALRHGRQAVCHTDDLKPKQTNAEEQQKKLEQAVLDALMQGGRGEVEREAGVYISWLLRALEDTEKAAGVLLEYYFYVKRYLQKEGLLEQGSSVFSDPTALLKMKEGTALRKHFLWLLAQLSAGVQVKQHRAENGMEEVLNYLAENLQRELSLEDAAQRMGMSPYYFSRIFKEETGEGFSEYVTRLRIGRAKALLRNQAYSIKAVCIESGYTNPNYFSRIFKKVTGVTPTEYRDGYETQSE